ncbi:MAG TPA: FAD-dependent oxidoreductase [Casimicrobiaceae bacterium]
MDPDYQKLEFPYARSVDQDAPEPAHHPVVVVGAGPVGLTAAIDLAQRGMRVVLLDEDNRLSTGSRAICFAKRTLEIWDRLGCGERMVQKGVSWNVGKVYFQDKLVYSFNLLPEPGHHRPAFINLQQYYCEGYLCEQAQTLANLDLRWKHKVVAIEPSRDGVNLDVETPEGAYRLRADYVIACDGARSSVRGLIGQESTGRTFDDRFLIADVKMEADFPPERWFWFDPPFHRHQSTLLHRQPDNVWRIDFQLGRDTDPELEKTPERVVPRVRALLGETARFEVQWVSVYTFSCARMENFRHGRILFAGDAAHCVSPFGARGANSGVQDAENLAWKLAWVLERRAPETLLDSYSDERRYAADENIRCSTRATDFITPKNRVSRTFRDATLKLAKDFPFARRLVNSGRLSVPTVLRDSWLNTPDGDAFAGDMIPGAPCVDGPIAVSGSAGWLLTHLGNGFNGIYFSDGSLSTTAREGLTDLGATRNCVHVTLVIPKGATLSRPIAGASVVEDRDGAIQRRFDARPGTFYLLRPDQHVCARWRSFDVGAVETAIRRAVGNACQSASFVRPLRNR